jgi:replication factor A1
MLEWEKDRSTGNYFWILLLDASRANIRGIFFWGNADNWINRINVDCVYNIRGAIAQRADTRYQVGDHNCELHFEGGVSFDKVADDGSIVGRAFHFLPGLDRVVSQPNDTRVDVVGIVRRIGSREAITTKFGRTQLRRVLIFDRTGEARMALWGKQADLFPENAVGKVVQVRNAKISNFRGKELSSGVWSIIEVRATEPEALSLQRWFAEGGGARVW